MESEPWGTDPQPPEYGGRLRPPCPLQKELRVGGEKVLRIE
ncbi:MAG: hypothetical protein RBJ76_26270 [Stenomitos frigidus ULC029]